jgi:hypothetical protein
MATDLTNIGLDTTTLDGKVYFVVKHSAGTLKPGITINVSIILTGNSSIYY